MESFFTLVLLIFATLGCGTYLLRVLGIALGFEPFSRLIWTSVIGFGFLGWLVFFFGLAGWLSSSALIILCVLLSSGVVFLGDMRSSISIGKLRPVESVLAATICVVLVFDLIEGLAPPADADTLAYHFATPKLFLEAGRFYFIPRAGDGAVPLLQQMTYMLALGIGGETAATLWTMATGWLAGTLVYVVARHYMDRTWALAAALLFLTTPIVIYSAGTGQIEVRNAAFVLACVFALAEARRNGGLRYVLVAGIAAGFFVASKYTGLLFAFSCGVILLFQRRWLLQCSVFTAAVVVAGGEWYAWNWWHTGDPVFPVLYGLIDYPPDFPWSADIQRHYFEVTRQSDRLYPLNIIGLFQYPIFETIFPSAQLESLKAGMGIFWMLAAPLIIVQLFHRSALVHRTDFLIFIGVGTLSYILWFFFGPSQRVRHLMPLYPLMLITGVFYCHLAFKEGAMIRPAICAIILVPAVLQFGAHGISTIKYFSYFWHNQTRDQFLERSISRYPAVKWINDNLSSSSVVFNPFRETIYLMSVPTFYAHNDVQDQIDVRFTNRDAEKFWRQLRNQGITHVFDGATPEPLNNDGGLPVLKKALVDGKCLKIIKRIESPLLMSRTFGGAGNDQIATSVIAALTPKTCIY
jgi:hypothetical protein